VGCGRVGEVDVGCANAAVVPHLSKGEMSDCCDVRLETCKKRVVYYSVYQGAMLTLVQVSEQRVWASPLPRDQWEGAVTSQEASNMHMDFLRSQFSFIAAWYLF
jgi:hypothetical protein